MSDLKSQAIGRVEQRVCTILGEEPLLPERQAAIQPTIDLGEAAGTRPLLAQINDHTSLGQRVGRQVSDVVNFPKRQIRPFRSARLVKGFIQLDGSVILAVRAKPVATGARLA